MKNSLFNVLSSFTKSEMRSFGKFLNSPYHNQSSKVVILFTEIKKYYPSFSSEKLSPEALHLKLFPEKPFKDSTLRNLYSDLYKISLEFIALENFKKSKTDSYKYLFTGLTEKKLNREFTKEITALEEKLDKYELLGWDYFLNRFSFEVFKYNFYTSNITITSPAALQSSTRALENAFIYLTQFYLKAGLSAYVTLAQAKTYYRNEQYLIHELMNNINLPEISKLIASTSPHPYFLDIYLKMLYAFSHPGDTSCYFDYKSSLRKYGKFLDNEEKCFHYHKLILYCQEKINNRDIEPKFARELLNLYHRMLEEELYMDKYTKYLSYNWYRAIILHGIRLKAFKWVRSFIASYTTRLPPKEYASSYNWAQAYFYYSSGNIDEALFHINKIHAETRMQKYDIKNLTLLIYYERNYIEESLSLIKSYLQFIRKDDLSSQERKEGYKNFILSLESILRYKAGYNLNLDVLKQKIRNSNNITYKDWLLETIVKLEEVT
jgi:hypothetical protein